MLRRLKLAALVLGSALAIALVLTLTSPYGRALLRFSAAPDELVVPVAGVPPRACASSFGEPRSGHRQHQGIDIFAPRGTEVLSATDGQVVRIGHDRLGGNVVWVAGEGATLYYYAHLERFEPTLTVGEQVRRGATLGFVGTTGNARGTPPHLHFAIYPARRAFVPIDPAPILQTQARAVPGKRRPSVSR